MKTKHKGYSLTRPAKCLKIKRKKHPCSDCRICRECADARCAVCRA